MPLFLPTGTPEEVEARAASARGEVAQYSLRVYRALEQDLLEFERHVPMDANHLGVFSLELWSVILRACAEVDSQLYSLLNELGLATGETNIQDYRNAESVLHLGSYVFRTVPAAMEIVPFRSFQTTPGVTPTWWRDYNAVKHRRLETIREATFINALASVAGVAAVLLRQWGSDLFPRPLYLNLSSAGYLAPFPSRLFSLEGTP